jgi:hypothetical protein
MKAGEMNSRFGLVKCALKEGNITLFFDCGESFHQPALSAGGIILVDHTLLRSTIQVADGCKGCLLCNVFIAFDDGGIRLRDKGTGTPAVDTVVYTAFFILPVSLDL